MALQSQDIFPFFSLSRELRDTVYTAALREDEVLIVDNAASVSETRITAINYIHPHLLRIDHMFKSEYLEIVPQVRSAKVTVETWDGMGREDFEICAAGIEDLRYILTRLRCFPNLVRVRAVLQLSMAGHDQGTDVRDDESKSSVLAAGPPINDLVANTQRFSTVDLRFDDQKLKRRVTLVGNSWREMAYDTQWVCGKHNCIWYTATVAEETKSKTTWKGWELVVEEAGSWDECLELMIKASNGVDQKCFYDSIEFLRFILSKLRDMCPDLRSLQIVLRLSMHAGKLDDREDRDGDDESDDPNETLAKNLTTSVRHFHTVELPLPGDIRSLYSKDLAVQEWRLSFSYTRLRSSRLSLKNGKMSLLAALASPPISAILSCRMVS
nr:hypothetical protein B0A51_11638 [Rachicladosporium sp. CCFEE 5018]